MTDKRFTETVSTGIVTDNVTGKEYNCEMRIDDELLEFLNELAEENKEQKTFLKSLREELQLADRDNTYLEKENKELIQHIKKLEKQLYLVHMSSMFSTVQSFKGDVSKRYYYSEKTDRVYDTANTYGQYDKVLEKKEIAMLLNEYETLLNDGDLE